MKHRFLNAILRALLALLSLAVQAQTKTQNKLDTLFPVAQKGYKKITVYVPKANKEQNLKLELLVGLTKQEFSIKVPEYKMNSKLKCLINS
jgi:serine protease inhibitor ecotin